MSEYQYYEFLAIDKPLSERQRAELRAISTRAHITATSFTNTYEWGDLKARPIAMMEKYFDAFAYVANWGTHEFMLRLPRRLLDAKTLSSFSAGQALSVEVKGEYVIVSFMSNMEPEDDWESGEGRLSSLVSLRAELLQGDRRSLYLGWLLGAQLEELKDGAIEPPVPPGLAKLSGPLNSLVDFLRIDPCLIEVAAEGSLTAGSGGVSGANFDRWLRSLPTAEKDDLLARLAKAEEPHIRAEVLRLFRQAHPDQLTRGDAKRRTVSELIATAEKRSEIKRREAAERAAQERARREKKEAIARNKYLNQLEKREPDIWIRVDSLITTKQPNKYDEAVRLLRDLSDLASRSSKQVAFRRQLAELRQRHSKKLSLLARIDRVGQAGEAP